MELACGFEVGRIGIEAQIEDAVGLIACEAIALASPRMETLIFGPGDYSASVGIPVTTIGTAPDGYPGDHLNYVYSKLVVAARAAGIQAIDGPYARVGDDEGLRSRSLLARALGFDGKCGRSTRGRSRPSTRSSGWVPRRAARVSRIRSILRSLAGGRPVPDLRPLGSCVRARVGLRLVARNVTACVVVAGWLIGST